MEIQNITVCNVTVVLVFHLMMTSLIISEVVILDSVPLTLGMNAMDLAKGEKLKIAAHARGMELMEPFGQSGPIYLLHDTYYHRPMRSIQSLGLFVVKHAFPTFFLPSHLLWWRES
jgi:hypothetical protein